MLESLAPARAERAKLVLPGEGLIAGTRRIGTTFTISGSAIPFEDDDAAVLADVPPAAGDETAETIAAYLRTSVRAFDCRKGNGPGPMPLTLDLLFRRLPYPPSFVSPAPILESGLIIANVWCFYAATPGALAQFTVAASVAIGPFGRAVVADFRSLLVRTCTPSAITFSFLQLRNRPLPAVTYEFIAACDVPA